MCKCTPRDFKKINKLISSIKKCPVDAKYKKTVYIVGVDFTIIPNVDCGQLSYTPIDTLTDTLLGDDSELISIVLHRLKTVFPLRGYRVTKEGRIHVLLECEQKSTAHEIAIN